MLSILIIDDSKEKIELLKKFILTNFAVIKESDIDSVTCTRKALNLLCSNLYDLVLLDLNIVKKEGGVPSVENAIEFLEEINEYDTVQYPAHILGITQADSIREQDKDSFEDNLWSLLKYGAQFNDWEDKLRRKITYIINSKQQLLLNHRYNYDVAIINALQKPEQEWLINVLGNDGWNEVKLPTDKYNTYKEKILQTCKGKSIRVVISYQHQMASVPSTSLATKMIYNFRPKYLFMTGIAAAVEPNDVNLGDILVAEEVWDGASGKYKDVLEQNGDTTITKSVFLQDPRQEPLDSEMVNIVNKLKVNDSLLNSITNNYPIKNLKNRRVDVHIGPMASVPAVIASKEELNKVQVQSRKLLGIEMESYGMFYAARHSVDPRPKIVASFKSASDYATLEKSDNFQDYASYTSAAFLKYIILNELDY